MKKISNETMENICTYMDDDIREELHFKLAPCSNRTFLKAYCKRDPGFEELLKNEFDIVLQGITNATPYTEGRKHNAEH